MSVGFLGPRGSFTFEIALSIFKENELVAFDTIAEVFDALNGGVMEYGVVPIENSIHGKVVETINNLKKFDLKIVKELRLDIHNFFCSIEKDIKDIKKIYSKDVAYNQCSLFLNKNNLLKVPFIPVESTSRAANIAINEKNTAAICSLSAAKMFNLNVLSENIEDKSNNKTRFFLLKKEGVTIGNKLSLIVKLENVPGSLYNFLSLFYENNMNMISIESRPDNDDIENFNYWFYIEILGDISDNFLESILKDQRIKFLGRY
jgi:chorismate mutase/prephenate dehydratase